MALRRSIFVKENVANPHCTDSTAHRVAGADKDVMELAFPTGVRFLLQLTEAIRNPKERNHQSHWQPVPPHYSLTLVRFLFAFGDLPILGILIGSGASPGIADNDHKGNPFADDAQNNINRPHKTS
jgi:hypothetical protein